MQSRTDQLKGTAAWDPAIHTPVWQKIPELWILGRFSVLILCELSPLHWECSGSCSGHREAKHRHVAQHCTLGQCHSDREVAPVTHPRASPFSIMLTQHSQGQLCLQQACKNAHLFVVPEWKASSSRAAVLPASCPSRAAQWILLSSPQRLPEGQTLVAEKF